MSKSYDAIYENPGDYDYVQGTALPNGGTLLINVNGDYGIANECIPDAKSRLSSLQASMSGGKVQQSQTRYHVSHKNEKQIFVAGNINLVKSWKVEISVEIYAFNGYGTFPDRGVINILVEKTYDEGASSKVECVGFIYQLKLDNTGPVDEYSDYYAPVLVGETPQKKKVANGDPVPYYTDLTFVGYPDSGAKYFPAAYWKTSVPNLQEMFIVAETTNIVHTGMGTQTPIVTPYNFQGLREGWEWVTEYTYTEGECGAELSNTWREETYSIYTSWPVPQPNDIWVYASAYGSDGSLTHCGMGKPGGVHYAGGFEITGEVFVPGVGMVTYGCSRTGANWAYADVGITQNDMLAHGYSQVGGCIGAFQNALATEYEFVLSTNPDTHDTRYKEFSTNYVGNPFRNSEGRGMILQGGWKFSEKDIELRMGATGYGEVSLFMITKNAKSMDFVLSQEVLDAGGITYGSPDHTQLPVGMGALYVSNSPWYSPSTTNDNFMIDTTYESSASPRFGVDIEVERGIHKVLLDDDRGGTAVCWCLLQITEDGDSRLEWNLITLPVKGNETIQIYVGELPMDIINAIAWKPA